MAAILVEKYICLDQVNMNNWYWLKSSAGLESDADFITWLLKLAYKELRIQGKVLRAEAGDSVDLPSLTVLASLTTSHSDSGSINDKILESSGRELIQKSLIKQEQTDTIFDVVGQISHQNAQPFSDQRETDIVYNDMDTLSDKNISQSESDGACDSVKNRNSQKRKRGRSSTRKKAGRNNSKPEDSEEDDEYKISYNVQKNIRGTGLRKSSRVKSMHLRDENGKNNGKEKKNSLSDDNDVGTLELPEKTLEDGSSSEEHPENVADGGEDLNNDLEDWQDDGENDSEDEEMMLNADEGTGGQNHRLREPAIELEGNTDKHHRYYGLVHFKGPEDRYNIFMCKFCGLKAKQFSRLIIHMNTHLDQASDRYYVCPYDESCSRLYNLALFRDHIHNKHVKEHYDFFPAVFCDYTKDNELISKCLFCSLDIAENLELLKHALVNHKGWQTHCQILRQPILCEVCGKSLKTKFSLINHMQSQHSDKKAYECKQCSYTTKTQSLLTRHIQRIHTEPDNLYVCDKCEYTATKKENFQYHVRVHHRTGPGKKFPCTWPDCGQVLSRKEHLKTHMCRHTGEKPRACKHCDYRCIQQGALMHHMSLQHPDVPYEFKSKYKSKQPSTEKQPVSSP